MTRIILIFACCIAAASCAMVPKVWVRTDGRPVDQAQLQIDQTICRDEVQKADQSDNYDEAELMRASADILVECMAQRGYLVAK
jgi:hypothetical protein